MSVIIFFSASKTFFFVEMMCKQLIFCVKAATRLVETIFNELYQALNMKKNPLRKFKFPCPFFISPI
jgi:hypothetical protein